MDSTFKISITASPALDEECRGVFLELKENLDGGTIKLEEREERATNRTNIIELFRHFVIEGASMGVFSAAFTIFKTWLDRQPTCEVTLTYPDGTQIKISKVTLAEAERLHEEHLRKLAAVAASAAS